MTLKLFKEAISYDLKYNLIKYFFFFSQGAALILNSFELALNYILFMSLKPRKRAEFKKMFHDGKN